MWTSLVVRTCAAVSFCDSHSYHKIRFCLHGDGVHAMLWCLVRADNYKCPCIRHVYIEDVWYDPGVWLWDTAGGLAVSCLSHLPRECQTVYLTRYSPSVFFLSHTCMHTHTHTHTHNISYVTNINLCLSPAEKCECKEQALTNSKLFCTMNYAYGKNTCTFIFSSSPVRQWNDHFDLLQPGS